MFSEQIGDVEQAFDWYQRALIENPTHESTVQETERLAAALDGWSTLANTYARALEQQSDGERLAMAGFRLAQLYEQELGDIERAEQTYRFVVGKNKKAVASLEALDRIYTEHGAFSALRDVLELRIAAVNGSPEASDLNYRLGQLFQRELHAPADAIRVYQHIINDLDSQNIEALHALQLAYYEGEQWTALLDAYEKELDIVLGDDAQAEVLGKMARLAAQRLQDTDKGISLWKRVLDIRGEDREALSALGEIYAKTENWRDLVDVLEREVAVADDDKNRVAIYTDLARVWNDKLQREGNALENWERVLDIDPGNADALLAMAQIHENEGAYQELVETLHRIVDAGAATLDDEALQKVQLKMGSVYNDKLEQPMEAVEAYRQVLEINPRNFSAIEALEKIHAEQGQWDAYIDVLERRMEATDEPDDKIQVLLSIGEAWESKAENPDGGVSAFERVLEHAPMHDVAFEKLEALHRSAERWEPLVELYLSRLEYTGEPDARRALFFRVASVYEKELHDNERAFDALLVAWTEDLSNEAVSAELERLAALTQRWNELLSQANEALQEEEDPELRLTLCLRCARWYGTELGHLEYAIPYYEEIRQLDPVNVPAMRQLTELYRKTEQWQLLAQVLVQLADMTDQAGEKMLRLVELGELCENELGVADQAMPYYKQALDVDSANVEALGKLEHVYRKRELFDELKRTLQRTVDTLGDDPASVAARLELAKVYEEHFKQDQQATDVLSKVLEIEPGNPGALKALQGLYTRHENWQELRSVFESQLDAVETERQRIDVHMQLAMLWEEQFVKPEKAAEHLEEVVALDPTHHDAYLGLARVYRRLQSWESLIETYNRHATSAPDRDLRLCSLSVWVRSMHMSLSNQSVLLMPI
ncbi:MAG: tetratricopeptide repeat protein [Myxococcales bacterium]|nr:MAG: tetratricopeptide repeat protein [Myxococcales bacterium]